MISCKSFYDMLTAKGVSFFTGVPDSVLKDFCAYITKHTAPKNHITAANEGGAVALACGHYLATGNIAVVYMQNSGTGNAINPLVSLADTDVCSIPLLLIVGYRGEPGKKDAPQHIKQGKITLSLLDTLGILYKILPDSNKETQQCVDEIFSVMKQRETPAALIVRKKTFEPCGLNNDEKSSTSLTREEAIKIVIDKQSPGQTEHIIKSKRLKKAVLDRRPFYWKSHLKF